MLALCCQGLNVCSRHESLNYHHVTTVLYADDICCNVRIAFTYDTKSDMLLSSAARMETEQSVIKRSVIIDLSLYI